MIKDLLKVESRLVFWRECCRFYLSFFLAVLFFIFLPVAVGVAASNEDNQKIERADSLDATFQQIRKAAAGVETISCVMVQEKYLKAFAEVLKAQGRFAFQRPDCWRWELSDPVVSGLSVCGERGQRWHEKAGLPQAFKLADEPWLRHFANQVTAWTTADFDFLQKQYALSLLHTELSAVSPTLKLVPRESAARRLIAFLEITFSADYRYVTSIIIREADGDYTAIKFFDVTINQPLPEGSFQ